MTADRRARRARTVLVGALMLTALGGCSSSTPKGPPSCTDTSAAGSRLAGGCVHDGRTYQAKAFPCTDGTTLYTVPFTPADGGASAFSNGTLRARTATSAELAQCLTGAPSS